MGQLDAYSEKNLAIIGTGYWGKNLLKNFDRLGVVKTICDHHAENLSLLKKQYKDLKTTTDFTEVLDDPEIKRVVLAVPNHFHFTYAKQAMLAGKDVFVEKPMCEDLASAEQLKNLAEESGRVLMVGHLLHYHPCIQKIKTMIAEGDLGEIRHFEFNRLNPGCTSREVSALQTFAPHDISILLGLMDGKKPLSVQCFGHSYFQSNITDTHLLVAEFENAITAHIKASWMYPYKERKLVVIGTKATVTFDDTNEQDKKIMLYPSSVQMVDGRAISRAENPKYVDYESAEPLLEECKHFIDCCLARQTPITDGEEGFKVLQVIHAAEESFQNDGIKQEIAEPEALELVHI